MAKISNARLLWWERNPHYEQSVRIVRYRSEGSSDDIRACLKIHKSDKQIEPKPNKNDGLGRLDWSVKGGKKHSIPEGCRAVAMQHKWTAHWLGDFVDEETGEIDEAVRWECTDTEMALSRKRKAIRKFTDVYSPLYEQRKVSVMFLTLTQADKSDITLSDFINAMQKRFLRHKIPVLGYFWVHEVSEGHHHHYHIAIATKRVFWKKIPRWVKFDDLWSRGTSIEFIRKSVKAYLGKYIGKNNIARILNYRKYGKSKTYKTP